MSDLEKISTLRNDLNTHIKTIISKRSIDSKKGIDFKKNYIYNTFKEIYNEHLKEFNDKSIQENLYNKLQFLTSKSNELENIVLPDTKNNDMRKFYEIEIDTIRFYIEKYSNQMYNESFVDESFKYYPEQFDPEFNKKLYQKKEFNKSKIPLITEDYINSKLSFGFQKSPTQKFVKNFISEYTPYNGLLLWHDVGVGKTCAGIGIAENFRDSVYMNGQKILILTPSDTLQQNWKDEIVNIEKEIDRHENKSNKNVQCTGTKYINQLFNISNQSKTKAKRDAKKLIEKYYEFYGYQKLVRKIDRELKQRIGGRVISSKILIDYIKSRFSNRVIIMDEVHVTRDSGTAKDKLAQPYIELIARYAENTKIILLSATPMYNLSREIIWLLNILLLNDKKAPLNENEIFENDGETLKKYPEDKYFGDTAINILINKSRGYISYLQGENPFTFPIKLYPNDKFAYTPKPDIDKKQNKIPSDTLIKGMTFYKNELSEWQYKYVKQFTLGITDKEGSNLDEQDVTNSFSQKPTAASNVVFPTSIDENGEFVGGITKSAFKDCFIENAQKNGYNIADHLLDVNKTGKTFIHRDNLYQFSAKSSNILNSILTCEGISFVYSQFIPSGVLFFALVLEQNGFTRYVGEGKDNNFLDIPDKDRFCSTNLKYESQLTSEEKKNFTPAKYVLLTAEHTTVQNRNVLVNEIRGSFQNPNTNGELIKVILGTRVVEQGISFRRVRETHIMEPWHHLNQMHQAVGRSSRFKSHMELEDKKRNVTIYLHIGALPSTNTTSMETSDEYIYRRAYQKQINMSEIEYILKRNAIDCQLNKLGNMFLDKNYNGLVEGNPLKNKLVLDSKNNERIIDLSDKDYTNKCNFKKCDYTCLPEVDFDKESVNSDTFNEFFAEDDIELIKEYIKSLFDTDTVYSEADILNTIKELNDLNISDEYVYIALSQIINNKEIVYDSNKRPGYIIDRFGYYIFQPNELEDIHLPILYRYLLKEHNTKQFIDLNTEYSFNIDKTSKTSDEEVVSSKDKDSTKTISYLETTIKGINLKLSDKYTEVSNYIEMFYSYYPTDKSHINKDIQEKIERNELIIPLQQNLKDCLFLSFFEKGLTIAQRIDIIKLIVTKEINNEKLTGEHDEYIKNLLLNFYSTHNTINYIIREQDIDKSSTSNNIIGFRFYDGIYRLFITDGKQPASLVEILPGSYPYDILGFKNVPNNKALIYGFVENRKDASRFYIVNKDDGKFVEVLNQNKSKSKKSDRGGGICGTALGVKTNLDVQTLVNKLLGYKKYEGKGKKTQIYNYNNIKEFKISTGPNIAGKPNTETEFKTLGEKASYCQEIELLLRYKELYSTNVTSDYRYYYKFEEKLFINNESTVKSVLLK